MRSIIALYVGAVLSVAGVADAALIFRDDFTGSLAWATSNDSIQLQNEYLHFSSNGDYWDYARAGVTFSSPIDLSPGQPIVVEQRLRLVSGGGNYLLPWEVLYFEGSSAIPNRYFEDPTKLEITSLPVGGYGWSFGSGDLERWTHSNAGAPASENCWVVTRIILTPTGGELLVSPDGYPEGHFTGRNDAVVAYAD